MTLYSHLGTTAILALVPFAIIAGTSFAKIAMVLHMLSRALGAPGIPPASVITALAAVVSMFVMAPVASEMTEAVQLAFGGEYRKESLFFTPDEVNQIGGATGQGGAQPDHVGQEGKVEQ